MANTFELIASNTTTTTTSLTFASIPSTFTDLCLMVSARTTSGIYDSYLPMNLTFNSISSGYSEKTLEGSPANSGSGRSSASSGASQFQSMIVSTDGTTANTFANVQIYVFNYSSSSLPKFISYECAPERDAQNVSYNMGSGLNTTTEVVTSIRLEAPGQTFVSGSTFYLYGIKNS